MIKFISWINQVNHKVLVIVKIWFHVLYNITSLFMLLTMMNIQDINSETFISFGHHKSFPWWNFYPFFPYGKSLRIFNIRIKSYQSFHIFTLFLSLVIKFLSRFVNWIQVFRQRVECIFKCKYQTSAMCRVQVSNQYHNSFTVTV